MTRNEHIVELFHAGHSQHAIAKAVSLSQPGVRKILVRLGCLTPKRREEQTAPSPFLPPALPPSGTLPSGAVSRTEPCQAAPMRSAEPLLRRTTASPGYRCEWCQEEFLPWRPGQRFC